MKRLLMTLALGTMLALGGCSAITAATSTVDTTSYAKAAADAKIGYDAALKLATRYAQRPRCGQPTSPIICSDRAVLDAMLKASDAADAATQAAENAVRGLGSNPTVVAALVKASTESVAAFTKITTAYARN